MNAFVSAFSREISVMIWEDHPWSRAPCWRCGRIARLHWVFSCTTRLATICAYNRWGPWMLVVVFSQFVADKWCDMWRIHRHVDCVWWLEIIWLWYLLCDIYIYICIVLQNDDVCCCGSGRRWWDSALLIAVDGAGCQGHFWSRSRPLHRRFGDGFLPDTRSPVGLSDSVPAFTLRTSPGGEIQTDLYHRHQR